MWDEEEYYPVIELLVEGTWEEHEIEISEDLLARYRASKKEFWEVQHLLRNLIEEQKK